LKGTVNWFAVSAKVGGNVFYAIVLCTSNKNLRKFMKLMKYANS
jgi:hypothetical protein